MKKQVSETFIAKRLHSLDALRGFDMFWIIGADQLFHRLADASDSPFWNAVSVQFTHPQWDGFHFYDLIFPLFLFIAGVATPFSVSSRLRKGKTKEQRSEERRVGKEKRSRWVRNAYTKKSERKSTQQQRI